MAMHSQALAFYDRSSLLNMSDCRYSNFVGRLFDLLLFSDVPTPDISTNGVFSRDKNIQAVIVAKSQGVVCGGEEIEWYLRTRFKTFVCHFELVDGSFFDKGQVMATLRGSLKDILMVERFMLNVLQRLCGISFITRRMVNAVLPVRVAATRKTLWGILDKKAVSTGGGLTHRLSLSDGMLIKDSHLDVLRRDFAQLKRLVKKSGSERSFLVIEVDNFDELVIVVGLYNSCNMFGGILLDNFLPEMLLSSVSFLVKEGLRERICVEASGGITLENFEEFAHTGVDVISAGCLTMNPPVVDLSMEIF